MAKKAALHSPSPKISTTPSSAAAAARTPPASRATSTPISSPVAPPTPASKPISAASLSPRSSPQEIVVHVWNKYLQDTPSRTMLLDGFMAWLVIVGVVQFVYCVLAGNYPFNAFLSGFSAAVGQFVLTASLRMQTSERPPTNASAAAKKTLAKSIDPSTGALVEEGKVSTERAFADFVFGSLILHGFCVNFIN